MPTTIKNEGTHNIVDKQLKVSKTHKNIFKVGKLLLILEAVNLKKIVSLEKFNIEYYISPKYLFNHY